MAAADRIYADPSALLALYIHEPASAATSAWRWRTTGALPLTLHGRLEIVNGIGLAGFRKAISAEAMKDAMESFEEDIADGQYVETDVLWRATLRRASELSAAHTPAIGCRTLDVLHVATALELELPFFLSLDVRQRRLAKTAGLRLVQLPQSP
ncbi:MAG TPA: type II toxin-antitoxin system VapC family toxin [Candidatus Limnocylindrales bacterium]|nr:type II toxin-antitoxin system VapC family toxin [Candidatus Limnocylindrales bacterium]